MSIRGKIERCFNLFDEKRWSSKLLAVMEMDDYQFGKSVMNNKKISIVVTGNRISACTKKVLFELGSCGRFDEVVLVLCKGKVKSNMVQSVSGPIQTIKNFSLKYISNIIECITDEKYGKLILADRKSIIEYLVMRKRYGHVTNIFDLLAEELMLSKITVLEERCHMLNEIGVKTILYGIPQTSDFDMSSYYSGDELKSEDSNVWKCLCGYMPETEQLVFRNEFRNRSSSVMSNGKFMCGDYYSTYFNCINGERVVHFQPRVYKKTVWLIGVCIADSSYAEDKYTIASWLQKYVNEEIGENEVCVRARGHNLLEYTDSVNFENIKAGDLVIFMGAPIQANKSLIDALRQISEKEKIFIDVPAHCNYIGNQIYAHNIFEKYLSSWLIDSDTRDEGCLEDFSSHEESVKGDKKKSQIKIDIPTLE